MTAGLPIVGRTRIVGPGVDLVSVYGYPGIALFQVQASAKVAVSGLTLTNGQPHYERGGAVNNAGTLDITGCAVNNNSTRGGIGGANLQHGHANRAIVQFQRQWPECVWLGRRSKFGRRCHIQHGHSDNSSLSLHL